jgi:hypothetical protein
MVFNYRIQLMRVLVSSLVFIRLHNTPPHVKRYVMELNVFLVYPKRGITCLVSLFGHEKYLLITCTKIIQPMVLQCSLMR